MVENRPSPLVTSATARTNRAGATRSTQSSFRHACGDPRPGLPEERDEGLEKFRQGRDSMNSVMWSLKPLNREIETPKGPKRVVIERARHLPLPVKIGRNCALQRSKPGQFHGQDRRLRLLGTLSTVARGNDATGGTPLCWRSVGSRAVKGRPPHQGPHQSAALPRPGQFSRRRTGIEKSSRHPHFQTQGRTTSAQARKSRLRK